MSKNIIFLRIIIFAAFLILLVLLGVEHYKSVRKAEQIDNVVYEMISEAKKNIAIFQTNGDEQYFDRGISGLYTFYKLYPLVSEYIHDRYMTLHKTVVGFNTNYSHIKERCADQLLDVLEKLENNYNDSQAYIELEYLLYDFD